MSKYVPDKWVVLRITNVKDPTNVVEKVLAGWKDFWRLNSGISAVEVLDDKYIFKGYSGSSYVCYKDREGFTDYSKSILKQINKANKDHATIEVIEQG